MKYKDSIFSPLLKGQVLTRLRNKETGDIIEESSFEENTILNTSREVFILAVLNGQDKNKINIIKLGTDMGDGNSSMDSGIDPENESLIIEPHPSIDANAELDKITTKRVDSFDFKNEEIIKRMKFFSRFDSTNIIEEYKKENNITNLAAIPVTSASLYSKQDIGFSYKRFPAKYLMKGMVLEIEWIIDWEVFG